jgi:uncharacterized protein with FMN-binding domain
MVFQMKRIIKAGVCALIGLALILALIFYLTPKSGNGSSRVYAPGTYSARLILHSKPVDVAVTVTDKEITGVELKNMSADQEAFYPLFKPALSELSQRIIKYQTTKIAAPDELMMTSRILLNAVDAALRQAQTP